MKRAIKINESELVWLVGESVKKLVNERSFGTINNGVTYLRGKCNIADSLLNEIDSMELPYEVQESITDYIDDNKKKFTLLADMESFYDETFSSPMSAGDGNVTEVKDIRNKMDIINLINAAPFENDVKSIMLKALENVIYKLDENEFEVVG